MLNAKHRPLKFPDDLLRFLYWVFFKPLTLFRYINSIDPALSNREDTGLFALLKRRKEHPEFIQIIRLAFFHIFLTPWPLGFLTAFGFQIAGFEVDWLQVAVGVAVGVAFGVAFIIGYYRLLFYTVEAPWSFLQNIGFRGGEFGHPPSGGMS